jgi:hypothetical protein
VIGTWQTGAVMELAKAIVEAIQVDALFMRATAQH